MAKIIDNTQGRRMIRLSADDVLMVVSLYQQQVNRHDPENLEYSGVRTLLSNNPVYLPEEV